MARQPLVRITTTRRVYVRGYRLHHGLAGLALMALGALLTGHDWHDRPWPIRDRA